jgi:hypothetical protein
VLPLRELVEQALGKGTRKGVMGCFFVECQYSRHSAKSLSSSPVAVTETFLCRVADKKCLAKKPLPMYSSPILICRVSRLTKTPPSVFHAW